jgi:hypothetical protein
MLSNLLSGIIGAVLGSLISAVFLNFAERLKSRRQLAIEIIDHIEILYNRLMALATVQIPELSQHRQARGVTLLNDEEKRQFIAEFLRLLTTYSPFAKIEIIFNDSQLVSLLESLTKGFQDAFHNINNNDEFMRILNTNVDPNYGDMCHLLKDRSKLFSRI